MKVLIIADADSIHTYRWVIGLSKFCEIILYSFRKPVNHNYNIPAVKLYYSQRNNANNNLNKLLYLTCLSDVKKIVKKNNPDIIHAHYASSYGLIASLLNHKNTIISVWGTDIYEFPNKSFIHKCIIKRNFSNADCILSTSHIMAKEANRYTNKDIQVTPFGVDIKKFHRIDKSSNKSKFKYIGITKSLNTVYGIDVLIKAFKIVIESSDNKDIKLMILGDGPERNNLQKLVNDLNIDKYVEFVGWVDNSKLCDYYNSFYISVFPSLMESFGVAALESMACGIPVVTSDAEGYLEIINEKVGVIVPKGNHVILANEIIKLLMHPDLREKMSLECVEYVKSKFNFENNIKQMLNIYNKILEG